MKEPLEHTMNKDTHSTNDIKKFWNENPVGNNFVPYVEDKKFYTDYDAMRYRTEGHILGELDKLDLKDKVTLEIGLGQGADSMQLIERGAIYHGIDLTEESVRRVKERFNLFQKNYQQVQVANAEHIPYPDNYFDVVYSHGVIHHSPQIQQIVAEIHRVLKPGGRIVLMLYYKNSYNYYISIAFIRRIGLLFLKVFPFLAKLVSKLTGESVERINRHKYYLKKDGLSYLSMKTFIHHSTDGPDNVYSSVWTKRSSKQLLSAFKNPETAVHFLNERHLMGLQYLLPASFKRFLARRYGWHLWIKATK
jgi:ubiquinone/menaquinone biosynthesis C-methylase UbiE